MKTKDITPQYIEKRVSNWIERLNDLYKDIRMWSNEIRYNHGLMETDLPQKNEEMMRENKVKPKTVPGISIISGNKRISFVPFGLWILGANGRVNITTNEHQYMLVDFAKAFEKPDWQFVSHDFKNIHIPWNKEKYLEIVEECFGNDSFTIR